MVSKAAQFLAKHQNATYPGIYFIQRRGSFREQTKEAVVLVRSAFKETVFQEDSTLLVIGGGVSGLAAGLEAAKRGMLVTLIESKSNLLSVQRKCHTRFLHPNEYKWPRANYNKKAFPCLKHEKSFCPPSLRWRADIASKVAERIEAQVESEAPSNLIINVDFQHIPISLESLRASFDKDGDFDFILICAGAEEQTNIGKFQGVRYWGPDSLEKLSTLSGRRKAKKVVISGGGDGGLQDFLRVIHKPTKGKLFSAGNLLKQLLPKLHSSPAFKAWVKRQRKYTQSHRPPVAKLWQELTELFDLMEQDAKRWKAISRLLSNNVDSAIIRKERSVQLIFQDTTFSPAYTLNAFLVHLVSRVLKGSDWLRPNQKLLRVDSASSRHRCAENAAKCCGLGHTVVLKHAKQRGNESIEADVIVIRHGSKQALTGVSKKGKAATS